MDQLKTAERSMGMSEKLLSIQRERELVAIFKGYRYWNLKEMC